MSYYNDLHAGNIPGTEENEVEHKEDNSGVQDWSKGEFYPWVWTYMEPGNGRGEFFYKHPDGRKTCESSFVLGYDDQRRRAYKTADDFVRAAIKADEKPKPKCFNLGDKLRNGATVIHHIPDGLVLAALCFKGVVVEYVSWRINKKGDCYAGHYFQAFNRATEHHSCRANDLLA